MADSDNFGGMIMRMLKLVSLVASMALLAGCGGTSVAAEPVLVWPDGTATTEYDSDVWVRAVYEAEVAYARAFNTADFSRDDVKSTWSTFILGDAAIRLEGQLLRGTARVQLGPRPLVPLGVEVAGDGKSATVLTCVDKMQLFPPEDDGNPWPNVSLYKLEMGNDGHRRVVGVPTGSNNIVLPNGESPAADVCDGMEIPRAVFSPEPDLDALRSIDPEDLVPPENSPHVGE